MAAAIATNIASSLAAGGFFTGLANLLPTNLTGAATVTQAQMLALLATLEKLGVINHAALTPEMIVTVTQLLAVQGVNLPASIVTALMGPA